MVIPLRYLLTLLAVPPLSVQERAPRSQGVPAVLVRVQGVIQETTVALVNRAFREARARSAAYVVVELDTPGGVLDCTQEMVQLLSALRRDQIKTVAYVPHQALSAGAMLALACDQIVMGPSATLGACTPVAMAPGGIMDIPDSDAAAKIYSAVRADMRALCEKRGKSVALLAEAMVDPRLKLVRVTYKDAGNVEHTTVVEGDGLLELERAHATIVQQEEIRVRPLTLTMREALDLGVADNTVSDRHALLEEILGVDPKTTLVVESSWSEDFVAFLISIKFFLLIGGAILLYVEFTTPGFGVPGALGILCFVLFFTGGLLTGLAEWTEILLFALGLGLILLELLVFPGTIVAGLVGFLAVLAALFLSFQSFVQPGSNMESWVLESNLVSFTVVLAVCMVLGGMFSRFLPRLPGFKRMVLEPGVPEPALAAAGGGVAAVGTLLLGKHGVALTDLRPAGSARVDGQPIDVVADGEYVARGSAVQVLRVEGHRVVVGVAPSGPSARGERGQTLSLPLVVLLLFASLVCLVASVFFPTFGVLEITAAVGAISAVFLGFQHGQGIGFLFMAVVGLGAPVLWFWCFRRLLPKTPMGKHLILEGPSFDLAPSPAQAELSALRDQAGTALSDLRPSGIAEIGGRRVDVVTRGELVARGAPLKVVLVEGSRVVVASVTLDPPAPAPTQPG